MMSKKPKRKVSIRIIVCIAVCSILVISWMFLSFCLLYDFSAGSFISLMYHEELEWMEGKSEEEIEARFGPADKHPSKGATVYYVWKSWIIGVKGTRQGVHFDASYGPSLNFEHPFKMQDLAIKYCICNFVGSVLIFFGGGAVILLICEGIKHRRERWNAYLDADQAYRKTQVETVEEE